MKETLKINLKVSEKREKEILSESRSKVYLLRNWGYPFAYPFFLSGLLKAMADTSIGTCRPSSWSLSCGDIILPPSYLQRFSMPSNWLCRCLFFVHCQSDRVCSTNVL